MLNKIFYLALLLIEMGKNLKLGLKLRSTGSKT